MTRPRQSSRTVFGLLLVVPLLLAGAILPAAAHHSARIEIHKAVCPRSSANPYRQCHDNRLADVPFTVAGVTRLTNANGVVVWTPGAGTKTIREDAKVSSKYGAAYVYCSEFPSRRVLFNGTTRTGAVTITTVAGTSVVCDWYNLT